MELGEIPQQQQQQQPQSRPQTPKRGAHPLDPTECLCGGREKLNGMASILDDEMQGSHAKPTEEQEAAWFSGLIYDQLGPREGCCLPRFIAENKSEYLRVRNTILKEWYRNPFSYLSLETATKTLGEKDKNIAQAVFEFLKNYGYINAGVLTNQPGFGQLNTSNPHKKRIIVIGAGMSGLTAARQLQSFGHDVVVIEARDRLGGRVNTDTKTFNSPVDMGASIITGLTGNPIGVVTKQIETKVHKIGNKCPLFLPDGKELTGEMDELLFEKFNMLEQHALKTAKELRANNDSNLDKMGLLDTMREAQEHDMEEIEKQVINWHITNLEYGCATNLKNLSLEHWNQDDPYGFQGTHLFLKEGYSTIIEKLAEGLNIKLSHQVQRINYMGAKGVSVECSTVSKEGKDGKESSASTSVIEEGDMVLVTVSLGVLKSKMIRFSPSLPTWKQIAIDRLGFGLINKLVLEWKDEDIFWRNEDMFGHVKEDEELRGNNYMFWNLKNVTDKPILVSIFAGDAAVKLEETPLEQLVAEAMTYLRRIYGSDTPEPIRTFKTGWKNDPFARGTYSYVGIGASGKDYDSLARPVKGRLFFAGEATCRLYPATVPGAHASGLFAAGQIADAANPIKHDLFKASTDSIIKSLGKENFMKNGIRYRRGVRKYVSQQPQNHQHLYKNKGKADGNASTHANSNLASSSSSLLSASSSSLLFKREIPYSKSDHGSFVLNLMEGNLENTILGGDNNKNDDKLKDAAGGVNTDRAVTGVQQGENALKENPSYVLDLLKKSSRDIKQRKKTIKALGKTTPYKSRKRDELDDDGIVDMTDMLLSNKTKRRRYEEQSRQRLKKKIQMKLLKKERKMKKRGTEETGQDALKKSKNKFEQDKSSTPEDVSLCIRNHIQKVLQKYAQKFHLPMNFQDEILEKSFDKVIKDWNSKERTRSVKVWMRNEKRKKSLKSLVSKYTRRYAKVK